ncbi:hypothetical protein MALU111345_21910 [Marinicrinis lubricantis]
MTNPLSQNQYTYVGNNPINFVDPSGYCGILPDGSYYGCSEIDTQLLNYKQDWINESPHNRAVIASKAELLRQRNEGYWIVAADENINDYRYNKDDLYWMWYFGDNNIALLVDPETGEQYGKEFQTRVIKGYMEEQISNGFPDFWDGVTTGSISLSLGAYKQLFKLAIKKGLKGTGEAFQWTGKNFSQMGKNMSPNEMISNLEKSGWTKTIEPGGKKSGPATIFTDPSTGTKVRIHAEPGEGTPYFRVQNKGGGYLDDNGVFPSNATKQELRDATHFYFEK